MQTKPNAIHAAASPMERTTSTNPTAASAHCPASTSAGPRTAVPGIRSAILPPRSRPALPVNWVVARTAATTLAVAATESVTYGTT